MQENRRYKDSMFRKLFNDREKHLALFNALENTNYKNAADIKITTLEDVLFHGVKNDVSFRLGSEYIVLHEHQSTVNANMPIRFLFYAAELYRQAISVKALYHKRRLALPTPKFYTFYNGTDDMPAYSLLKLSDSYAVQNDVSLCHMELQVEVFNINYESNSELLQKCQPLREYSYFIAMVRNGRRDGMRLKEATQNAIKQCVRQGVLTDFLLENGREVFAMLKMEWRFEDAIQYARKESHEEGLKKGLKEGLTKGLSKGLSKGLREGFSKGQAKGIERTATEMLRKNFTEQTIAEITSLPIHRIKELKNRLHS